MKKARAPKKPGPAPFTIHFCPTISPFSNSAIGTSNPILAKSAFHPVSCAALRLTIPRYTKNNPPTPRRADDRK